MPEHIMENVNSRCKAILTSFIVSTSTCHRGGSKGDGGGGLDGRSPLLWDPEKMGKTLRMCARNYGMCSNVSNSRRCNLTLRSNYCFL